MRRLIKEIRFTIISTTSLIGVCYLLGKLQEMYLQFIEGKEWILIVVFPIIMFLMFLILSIKSK